MEELKTARRALTCLYIAVESHVADDVNTKVEDAFKTPTASHTATTPSVVAS